MSTASPQSDAGDGLDDRAMIRRLLSKYSRRDIDRLLEEEIRESSWYGSSQPPLNLIMQTEASSSTRPRRSCPASPTCRTDYACGFCAEIGITKTCTRRNDLRRHIDQFHNTNAIWLCQHPGCRMAFDWQTAYQLHLRNEHGGSQMRMEEAKVTLCPQTVFACGYEGCHHLVEATTDAGASAAWRAYTAHLIKHCDEGRGASGWDYSHRMRNLVGQPRVAAAWKAIWPGRPPPTMLRWDPDSSRTLRKLLETRHLDPLPRLVRCALALASSGGEDMSPDTLSSSSSSSSSSSPCSSPDSALELPVKKLCPAAAIKHEMRQGDFGVRSVMPFRAVPVSDGFVHGIKAQPSPPPPPPPPPLPPPPPTAALYGMLGTAAVFQQQLISFRHRPVDCSETSDDGCRWDDVYGPAVTGSYYDVAGPVMTQGHHHALLGSYGSPSSS